MKILNADTFISKSLKAFTSTEKRALAEQVCAVTGDTLVHLGNFHDGSLT